jgi:hypothetical protein
MTLNDVPLSYERENWQDPPPWDAPPVILRVNIFWGLLDWNGLSRGEIGNGRVAWVAEEAFARVHAEWGSFVIVDIDAFFWWTNGRGIGHAHVSFDEAEIANEESAVFQPVKLVHFKRWKMKTILTRIDGWEEWAWWRLEGAMELYSIFFISHRIHNVIWYHGSVMWWKFGWSTRGVYLTDIVWWETLEYWEPGRN